jgi:hypothetical protein
VIQRWRVVVLALGALAAVAVAIVVVIESTSGSSSASGDTGKPVSAGAATVRRRNLVATDTESGTLGYAGGQTVYDRLSGTITWLAPVGWVIRPGQALFDVDDRPVVLFSGSTPAFRDLGPSVSAGPDVLELNRDLRRLGFDPQHLIILDDIWQPATSDAVDLWQASVNATVTGTIALGQVVFLPGAQRITAVETVLGSTGQSSGGSSGSDSGGASMTPISRPEFVATAVGSEKGANSGSSTAVLSAIKALLKAEAAEVKRERASSSKSQPKAASGDAPAQAVLQTASTKLVVSVALDVSKKSEAVVGARLTVELPDGSTVRGRVTQVGQVAQSSTSAGGGSGPNGSAGGGSGGSGGSAATVPVTVALTGHHPSLVGLDQATVSVNFVQQSARHVLSVPVTALLATAGGRYTVQEAAAPHRLLGVNPGLFAGGYVQISGAGIRQGLRVTDSQG